MYESMRTPSSRAISKNFAAKFPRNIPMGMEEECVLIARSQKGDKKAQNILVEHNFRFIAFTVEWALRKTGVDIFALLEREGFADYFQVGVLAFMRAIKKYKMPSAAKLCGYSRLWIRSYVQEHILRKARSIALPSDSYGRSRQILNEFFFKDALLAPHEDLTRLLSVGDMISSIEEKLDSEKIVDFVIRNLDRRQAFVFLKRIGVFGEAETLQSVGDDIGVTRERVRQLMVKISGILAQRFAEQSVRRNVLPPARKVGPTSQEI